MQGIRLIAAMMGALLVLGGGIALGAQEETTDPGQTTDPALSAPPGSEPGPEIESKRTATSQTFQLSDGGRETRIYEAPVNYLDASGEWKPIGDGLEEVDGGGLSNGPNHFDVSLPDRLGADPVRLSVAGEWVSAELLGQNTETAQLEGDIAGYELPDGGTRFDFSSLANGLKEEIEIADASQPTSYSFALDASAGLTPELVDDGSIVFLDGEDHVVAVMPAPVISDSATDPPNADAVHYELGPLSAGGWRLTVVADSDWLSQPDRSWPARIDPTVTIPTPSLDCSFAGFTGISIWTGCGSGGQSELYAIYHPSVVGEPDSWARSLLRFDLSTIPVKAFISSAEAGLYDPFAVKSTTGVEVRRAIKNWTSMVTWLKYDSTNSWTSQGGDYDSKDSGLGAEILTSQRGSQAGWWWSAPALTDT